MTITTSTPSTHHQNRVNPNQSQNQTHDCQPPPHHREDEVQKSKSKIEKMKFKIKIKHRAPLKHNHCSKSNTDEELSSIAIVGDEVPTKSNLSTTTTIDGD
ncbi:hypothetical protein Dimus_019353 [Dionaea muscipula]